MEKLKNIFSNKNKMIVAIATIIFVLTTSAVVWSFAPRVDLKPSEYGIGVPYEQAMKDKKPVIVMFYADWCTYCMHFMPKMKILSEVYKDKYNIVMIDGDNPDNQKFVEEYSVSGFPTIYIVDPKIDNRVLINQALYDDLRKVRIELERYLRIRSMIKV